MRDHYFAAMDAIHRVFLFIAGTALVVITLWPDFVLFLPRLAGYTG